MIEYDSRQSYERFWDEGELLWLELFTAMTDKKTHIYMSINNRMRERERTLQDKAPVQKELVVLITTMLYS